MVSGCATSVQHLLFVSSYVCDKVITSRHSFLLPQNGVLPYHPWKLTFNAVLRVGNGCMATTLVVVSSGYAPSLHFPQPASASFPQTFAPFTEQISRHKWIALSHFEDADQQSPLSEVVHLLLVYVPLECSNLAAELIMENFRAITPC